jgi:hypothetical protein
VCYLKKPQENLSLNKFGLKTVEYHC